MSNRQAAKLRRDADRIDYNEIPLSGWLPRKEAGLTAHWHRTDGHPSQRRVVLEERTFGGWMMSGEWEATRTRYRVRLAVTA